MGADKFKKWKREQRRRSEKLRKWKKAKEEAQLKRENNPRLFNSEIFK